MPPRVREVVSWLKERGFEFHRHGKGDHDIYRNPETGETIASTGTPITSCRCRCGVSYKSGSAGGIEDEDGYGTHRLRP